MKGGDVGKGVAKLGQAQGGGFQGLCTYSTLSRHKHPCAIGHLDSQILGLQLSRSYHLQFLDVQEKI